MSINNSYSTLTRVVSHISNPNKNTGVLLEEIPADIGRSYEGYKRGGIIEGAEKFRKEIMSAVVWLFGIPIFNKAGNVFCEKILKIPMNIDLCDSKEGNDTICDSIEYLKTGINNSGFDTSEIKKYRNGAFLEKIKNTSSESLKKQIKAAKMTTILSSLALNCLLMGVVLPKINQKITAKKLQQQKEKNATCLKEMSIQDYVKENKQKKDISFGNNVIASITSGIEKYAYLLENNNTTRLVSTDFPMIAGRCATSRNKYEALEFILMDGGSIYFYNFCSKHIQKALRKFTSTVNIDPRITEEIASMDENILKEGLKKINNAKDIETLFGEKTRDEFYRNGTYGKYGKINKYVKKSDVEEIDKSVIDFLKQITKDNDVNNRNLNAQETKSIVQKAIKNTNAKNAIFMFAGLLISILGLAVIMPKLTFWVTKQLTGKNTFTGITDYESNK